MKKAKINNLNTKKDFYLNERGFVVFTSEYHLKRGYCCQSNCINCPYRDKVKVS